MESPQGPPKHGEGLPLSLNNSKEPMRISVISSTEGEMKSNRAEAQVEGKQKQDINKLLCRGPAGHAGALAIFF